MDWRGFPVRDPVGFACPEVEDQAQEQAKTEDRKDQDENEERFSSPGHVHIPGAGMNSSIL